MKHLHVEMDDRTRLRSGSTMDKFSDPMVSSQLDKGRSRVRVLKEFTEDAHVISSSRINVHLPQL